MFNTGLKPNTIVLAEGILGVIEGESLYNKGVFNVYTGNSTKRVTVLKECDIISELYCNSSLFAYQVFNKINHQFINI